MNPGDGVLYPTPGYPIYESQVDYFGGVGQPYRYHADARPGFAIDLDHLSSQITPATKVLIYNNLQNPLGLRELARRDGRDRRARSPPRPVGAERRGLLRDALLGHHHVDRIAAGDAVAHRDPVHVLQEVRHDRLAARCRGRARRGHHPDRQDQHQRRELHDPLRAGGRCRGAARRPERSRRRSWPSCERRRDAAVDELQQIPGIVVAKPESTFYLFPNVTEAMAAMEFTDVAEFADAALRATGVSFCTRRHFGRPLAGETRAVRALRLLGHLGRRHPGSGSASSASGSRRPDAAADHRRRAHPRRRARRAAPARQRLGLEARRADRDRRAVRTHRRRRCRADAVDHQGRPRRSSTPPARS